MPPRELLYQRLGYTFFDPAHLECALTHRSANKSHNERLEFLGDSVLNFLMSVELYHRFPEADEGDLSRLRAQLVKGETLGKLALELKLGEFLRLGEGELKSGGFRRESILADTVEAIIGAIYLDAGIEATKAFILRIYATALAQTCLSDNLKDPKTRLQELMQAQGLNLPNYAVIETLGQAHNQIFKVACTVTVLTEPVMASGNSRRKAEQMAAAQALELIKGQAIHGK
jgi:ribonuclease-3